MQDFPITAESTIDHNVLETHSSGRNVGCIRREQASSPEEHLGNKAKGLYETKAVKIEKMDRYKRHSL